MPFIITPDPSRVRLYYEITGKGEPLLLIAGRENDHHGWDLIRGDFEKRYQTIVFDARGTGQSDKPTEPPYSTPMFARDAVGLLDALGIARAHVYGFSMGGRIGQWLGIEYPKRVGALVLACTTPGDAHGVKRWAEVDAVYASGDASKISDILFKNKLTMLNPRFLWSVRASAQHPLPDYARKLHAEASEGHDAWARLPEITAPTLVLHGSEDGFTPVGNARILAERIPNAELQIIEGGRHMFFLEFRKQVNKLVLAFLERHPF
jgi:pimeloyl-ACP methyl ester carboxylesterase